MWNLFLVTSFSFHFSTYSQKVSESCRFQSENKHLTNQGGQSRFFVPLVPLNECRTKKENHSIACVSPRVAWLLNHMFASDIRQSRSTRVVFVNVGMFGKRGTF